MTEPTKFLTCATCAFHHCGECRRYPPQVVLWPNDRRGSLAYEPEPTFPLVSPHEWCGEWKKIAETQA